MFTTRFDTKDYLAEGEELPKVLTFAEAEIPVENRCNQNLRKKLINDREMIDTCW